MLRRFRVFVRWSRLLLACFALTVLAPAQALANVYVTDRAVLVQGGSPPERVARETSRCGAHRRPPRPTGTPAPMEAAAPQRPEAPPPRLFLIHRALLL